MQNYIIHNCSLVYMALYYKKLADPHHSVYITRKQFEEYRQLVIESLEKERNVANAFDYHIVEGQPDYNFQYLDEKRATRVRNVAYYYDVRTDTFYTPCAAEDLYFKSVCVVPASLLSQFTPHGYEKVLNINMEEVIQEKGSDEPGSEK